MAGSVQLLEFSLALQAVGNEKGPRPALRSSKKMEGKPRWLETVAVFRSRISAGSHPPSTGRMQ